MVLRCLDPKPHLLQSWEGVGCEGWPAGGGLHGAATSGRFQEWVANDGLGGMRFECCQYALGTLSPPTCDLCKKSNVWRFYAWTLDVFFPNVFHELPGFFLVFKCICGAVFPPFGLLK